MEQHRLGAFGREAQLHAHLHVAVGGQDAVGVNVAAEIGEDLFDSLMGNELHQIGLKDDDVLQAAGEFVGGNNVVNAHCQRVFDHLGVQNVPQLHIAAL